MSTDSTHLQPLLFISYISFIATLLSQLFRLSLHLPLPRTLQSHLLGVSNWLLLLSLPHTIRADWSMGDRSSCNLLYFTILGLSAIPVAILLTTNPRELPSYG